MGQFLRLKEHKMQAWIQLAVKDLKTRITADNTVPQATKDILNNFITLQSTTTGQMSEAAVSFGVRYAPLMAFD